MYYNSSALDDFNPRSDERSDLLPKEENNINANFNPRSDERSDCNLLISDTLWLNFNPRSDERSESLIVSLQAFFSHFNPRSDERSDIINRYRFKEFLISIHAPTNGATLQVKSLFLSL